MPALCSRSHPRTRCRLTKPWVGQYHEPWRRGLSCRARAAMLVVTQLRVLPAEEFTFSPFLAAPARLRLAMRRMGLARVRSALIGGGGMLCRRLARMRRALMRR